MHFLKTVATAKSWSNSFEEATKITNGVLAIDIDRSEELILDLSLEKDLDKDFLLNFGREVSNENFIFPLFDANLPNRVSSIHQCDKIAIREIDESNTSWKPVLKSNNALENLKLIEELMVEDFYTESRFKNSVIGSGRTWGSGRQPDGSYRDDGKEKDFYYREIATGARFTLNIRDVHCWILYNLVQTIVENGGGCFHIDFPSSTIPKLEDFLFSARKIKKENRGMFSASDRFDYLVEEVVSKDSAMRILNWYEENGLQNVCSFRLSQDRAYFVIGPDTRILAYHALKEGKTPVWLSGYL